MNHRTSTPQIAQERTCYACGNHRAAAEMQPIAYDAAGEPRTWVCADACPLPVPAPTTPPEYLTAEAVHRADLKRAAYRVTRPAIVTYHRAYASVAVAVAS